MQWANVMVLNTFLNNTLPLCSAAIQPGSGDITPVNLDRPTDEPIDTEMILRTTDPMFLYEKVFFALQTCIEQPGIPLDPIQNEQNWNKQWFE